MTALPALLLLTGCWTLPEEVRLTGVLLDEYHGYGLEGATVEVHDPLGEPWSQGTTGAEGAIDIGVPASSAFFVTFSADDSTVPTSFTGLAGSEDVVAEDGALFMRSAAELEALRAEFAACPRVDDAGPIIEGVVRPYLAVDQEPEELPTITTAWVTVYAADDTAYEACYLDDDGNSLPDGDRTGNTGRFAVFGVPEGPLTVEVSYDVTDNFSMTSYYIVRAAPGGVVPMYPAWVELP